MELRDPVSSASHLFTAVWAVFATLVMCRLAARYPGRTLPVAVYGVSMVLLYLASGTFHGLFYETPEERRFFQRLDQSAIYLLIAGTSTPILCVLLTGARRRLFLWAEWSLALLGVACLWVLPKAPEPVTVGLYLALGWLTIIPVGYFWRAVGWRAMNWVWLGAGLYTLGAVCELTNWPVIIPGVVRGHEVLHFCDTAASIAFFLFVMRFVIPFEGRSAAASETDSAPSPFPPDALLPEVAGNSSRGEF